MELKIDTKKIGVVFGAFFLMTIYIIWILNVQEGIVQSRQELEQQLLLTQERKSALVEQQQLLLTEQEQMRLALVEQDAQKEQAIAQKIAELQSATSDTTQIVEQQAKLKAQQAALEQQRQAALLEQQKQAALLEQQRQAQLQQQVAQRQVTRAS